MTIAAAAPQQDLMLPFIALRRPVAPSSGSSCGWRPNDPAASGPAFESAAHPLQAELVNPALQVPQHRTFVSGTSRGTPGSLSADQLPVEREQLVQFLPAWRA